jgi:hypothetical protein
MYGGTYMFRHYIVIIRERSWCFLRSVFNLGAVGRILAMGVLCLVA